MPDLGSIGNSVDPRLIRVYVELPLSSTDGPFNLIYGPIMGWRPNVLRDAVMTPIVNQFSVKCRTPGTLPFEKPVDAGTTTTTTVQVRKNSLYFVPAFLGIKGDTNFRDRPWLPYLEVVRDDGVTQRVVMPNTTDTWETLTIVTSILRDGVLLIRLVQAGVVGSSYYNTTDEAVFDRVLSTSPFCWWANLTAIET